MTKHCMLDIETLGTNTNAPIIQIGLVFFTREGIITSSQLTIDFDEALKHGEADGSTIKWWLQQSKEAQNTLFSNARTSLEAVEIINKLVEAQNPNYYWAHATFDFPILMSLYRKLGVKFPIQYRVMHDLRTLETLAGPIEWEPRTGIAHNALDDATHQAKHAMKLLNKLGVL